MKRFASILLIGLLALPLAALGEPAAETKPAQIVALGSAEVTVQPDIAVLTFDVRSTAETVTAAQNANADKLKTLNAALEAYGVLSEDIYATYYSVDTVYSYQYGKLGEGESPSSYSVTRDLIVKLHDVGMVGGVIDVALQNSAENSYSLTFESSQAQAAYDRALEMATADAMRKAALLAKASGLTLGQLTGVQEQDANARAADVNGSLVEAAATADDVNYIMRVDACVEVSYQVQ